MWIAWACIESYQSLLGCLPVRRVIQQTDLADPCSRGAFKAAAIMSACLQERQTAVHQAQKAAQERQMALKDQEASLNSEVNTRNTKTLEQQCRNIVQLPALAASEASRCINCGRDSLEHCFAADGWSSGCMQGLLSLGLLMPAFGSWCWCCAQVV